MPPILGLLLVASLFQKAASWGPFSHAAFGSLYLESNTDAIIKDTLRGTRSGDFSLPEAVFVTANAFPDAFKKTRNWMHSFDYAGFQLEQAAIWNEESRPVSFWNTSLEFVHEDVVKAFSCGYMLHLMEDYVGHHGYLNPNHDHAMEFNIDTLLYLLHQKDPPPWQYRRGGMNSIVSHPEMLQTLARFISETSQQYANWKGNITDNGLSVEQVARCVRRFSRLIQLESYALVANSKTYQTEMIREDACHATTFHGANATLQRAIQWTEESLFVFETNLFPFQRPTNNDSAIWKETNKILQAGALAREWVDDMYNANGGTICASSLTLQSPIHDGSS